MSTEAVPAGPDLVLHAPAGLPEVEPGVDLAALIVGAVALCDGDVVVVTSKVVSKAEGRLAAGDREHAITAQTRRVVAARGPLRIVENRIGLVMAAAGVDASNVVAGTVALLPADPDESARRLRRALHERTGARVAVVVSDTAGRAWRTGQTDIAIGVAGLAPTETFAGRVDGHGNELAVTEPAVADELASAAELASGKLSGRPVVVVRGLAHRVLSRDDDGPGAAALQRPRAQDLFNLGVREAVVAAVAGDDRPAFGAPADPAELVSALRRCGLRATAVPAHTHSDTDTDSTTVVVTTPSPEDAARCAVLAAAHGWRTAASGSEARLVPDA